ncbi:MAG: flagellar biosynthesis protein FlhF [Planctomycetota bacterium]|jgi:flagellar biosynthesis protein FlhF
MKIRKYFAADMRGALNLAREQQGDDVVILSNRKVLGGVELVAAEDYDESVYTKSNDMEKAARSAERENRQDENQSSQHASNTEGKAVFNHVTQRGVDWANEPALDQVRKEINSLRDLLEQQMSSLAWGEVGRQHPLWAGLLRQFGKLGINPTLARELAQQIPEDYSLEQAWRTALALLSYRIPVSRKSMLNTNTTLAFTGASGSGKTTTIAKLATNYVLEHGVGSIVLATLDSYRVGGREQLRSYARILGIPMRTINNKTDLSDLLDQFHGRKLILIDTAGLSPTDKLHKDQISLLQQHDSRIKTCLILPAISQIPALQQMADIYRPLSPAMCVITKLDEASSLGSALSIAIQEKLKIIYQCDGQQVPEDLHKGDAADLIVRAVSMMKRHAASSEEELMEQNFGLHAVYNPFGERYEH